MLYISILLAFFLGVLVGTALVLIWSLLKLRSIDKKIPKATVTRKLDPSIRDRLNKAFDITEQQLGILGALDQPQSGPLHGKHKNQLNSELKSLEDKKLNLLRSVLEDGHDPLLTILNADTNQKEKILLSEFLSRYEGQQASASKPVVEPKAKPHLKLLSKKDEDK